MDYLGGYFEQEYELSFTKECSIHHDARLDSSKFGKVNNQRMVRKGSDGRLYLPTTFPSCILNAQYTDNEGLHCCKVDGFSGAILSEEVIPREVLQAISNAVAQYAAYDKYAAVNAQISSSLNQISNATNQVQNIINRYVPDPDKLVRESLTQIQATTDIAYAKLYGLHDPNRALPYLESVVNKYSGTSANSYVSNQYDAYSNYVDQYNLRQAYVDKWLRGNVSKFEIQSAISFYKMDQLEEESNAIKRSIAAGKPATLYSYGYAISPQDARLTTVQGRDRISSDYRDVFIIYIDSAKNQKINDILGRHDFTTRKNDSSLFKSSSNSRAQSVLNLAKQSNINDDFLVLAQSAEKIPGSALVEYFGSAVDPNWYYIPAVAKAPPPYSINTPTQYGGRVYISTYLSAIAFQPFNKIKGSQ